MIGRILFASLAAVAAVIGVRSPGRPGGLAGSGDTLRYDLRPGDRLVYHQVLTEEVDARFTYGLPAVASQPLPEPRVWETRASWTTHLLVLEEADGGLAVGIQRNRDGVELIRYMAGEEEDPTGEAAESLLAQRASGEDRFADAIRIARDGRRLLPPAALREWPSKILWALGELPELPPPGAEPGRRWSGDPAVGLTLRLAGTEPVGGEECARVEGEAVASHVLSRDGSLPDTLRLRWWFCPATGLVRRLEFEGAYPDAVFRKVRQTLVLELTERRRGESLEGWLGSEETRSGALAALAAAERPAVAPEELYALLDAARPAEVRRILGLAHRSSWPPPPAATLGSLQESPDPRTRALAVRLLEFVPKDEARPLVERALDDADYFVRRAAFEWARGRLAGERDVRLEEPEDVRRRWDALADLPAPPRFAPSAEGRAAMPGLGRRADPDGARREAAAGGDGAGPASCADPAEWLRAWSAARRAAPQPAGLTMRRLKAPRFRGWPYAVHVPEDYRGDRPFPLLVYLAGNAGPVMEGVLIGGPAAAGSGYLAVFPDANGTWWEAHATAAMDALLREVLAEFHVDADRIYLSGLSNGGTGTYYYATHWPWRFTAAVSAMGGGAFVAYHDEPFPENSTHLPFLFLHGERDATITPDATRLTVEKMEGRKAPLETHYFPDRGHGITLGRGDDGRTFAFLQKHEERRWPRRLAFRARGLEFARHYWVEVLDKESGVAEVEAELREDGRIDLETRNVRRLRLLLHPDLLTAGSAVRVRWNGSEVFAGPLPADCGLLRQSLAEVGDPRLAWAAELELPAAP